MPPKYKEIQRRIEEDGWRLKDQSGSHMQYVHPVKKGKVTILAKPSATPPDGTYLTYSETGGTKEMREYAVIYERGPVSWGAYLPDLPGLVATADTLEEVRALIEEGLELHLESMLEDGDSIPEATSLVGTLKTDIVETWSPQLAKSA